MDEKSKLRLQSIPLREWEEDGNQITEQQSIGKRYTQRRMREIYEKLKPDEPCCSYSFFLIMFCEFFSLYQ